MVEKKDMAKDINEEPKMVKLDDIERLKLQNVNLQRQLLEERVKTEVEKASNAERTLTTQIESRYGIKMVDYQINLDTGDCTPLTPEQRAQRDAQMQQRPQPVRAAG